MSQLYCQGCGAFDATLRQSSHPYVISMIVEANESSSSGIWCAECRWKEAAKANAVTVLAGWWSLRGPKATINALRANFEGGKQFASANATMLRDVAKERFAVRDFVTAAKFARAAESVQPQQENKRLLQELTISGFKGELAQSQWRFAPFAPPAVLALVLVFFASSAMRGGEEEPAAPAPVQQAAVVAKPVVKVEKKPEAPRIVKYASAADSTMQRSEAHLEFEHRLTLAKGELKRRITNGDEIGTVAMSIRKLASDPKTMAAVNDKKVREAWDALQEVMRVSLQHYRSGPSLVQLQRSVGDSYNATVDVAVDAIVADMMGRTSEAIGKASEVEERSASIAQSLRDVRIRAAVLVAWNRMIDACIDGSKGKEVNLQIQPSH